MIIAQILRLIAAIFNTIADKTKDTKKIFIYNGISNFFCSVQYLLLGAITGAISCIVAILRNIIFYKYKEEVGIKELIIFLAILVMFNYSCFTGTISMIPVLTVTIYSCVLYTKNVHSIKEATIIICILEIIYDIVFKAYVGIAVCIIDIFVTLYSLNEMKKNAH